MADPSNLIGHFGPAATTLTFFGLIVSLAGLGYHYLGLILNARAQRAQLQWLASLSEEAQVRVITSGNFKFIPPYQNNKERAPPSAADQLRGPLKIRGVRPL